MSDWDCPLRASEKALVSAYDCAMLDLDGVVYVGPHAVEGVPELLAEARAQGMTLAFVTNNAARTPAEVAGHLRELGVDAATEDVVTSAQAAAREVAERVPSGSKVLVVGGDGLVEALKEHDLVPVSSAADEPAAVVQGFHRSVGWELLAEGAYAIESGLPWIASNLDLTIPTPQGIAPGNGTLVRAVAAAVGRDPDVVAGKPFRPLFDETVRRIASQRPLVVGDRLDTDIEGAVTVQADALLVMTGVTDVEALCRAEPHERPTYVAWTMQGLLEPHQAPQRAGDGWSDAGWTFAVEAAALTVVARGEDASGGLAAAAVASWEWQDSQGDTGDAPRRLDLSCLEGLWTND